MDEPIDDRSIREQTVYVPYEKLRDVIEKKMFSSTEELLPVISFNTKASAEDQKKHQNFVDRMVDKGFLKIQRIRNLQLFSSVISEVDAKRGEFRKMLKRAFDGALTPMMQFMIEHEGLSKTELTQLRKLVNQVDNEQD